MREERAEQVTEVKAEAKKVVESKEKSEETAKVGGGDKVAKGRMVWYVVTKYGNTLWEHRRAIGGAVAVAGVFGLSIYGGYRFIHRNTTSDDSGFPDNGGGDNKKRNLRKSDNAKHTVVEIVPQPQPTETPAANVGVQQPQPQQQARGQEDNQVVQPEQPVIQEQQPQTAQVEVAPPTQITDAVTVDPSAPAPRTEIVLYRQPVVTTPPIAIEALPPVIPYHMPVEIVLYREPQQFQPATEPSIITPAANVVATKETKSETIPWWEWDGITEAFGFLFW